MNVLVARHFLKRRLTAAMLAVLLFGCCAASAQEKKASAPKAPSKPVSSTAKPAGAGTSTTHGPTTSASHGPTTSTAHGPTTNAPHGPTTSNPHGATTNNPHGATTTAAHSTTRTPNGGSTRSATLTSRPSAAGSKTVRTANGTEIRTRANGRPADVHIANRGMNIHHGLNGSRRIEVERADHARIVAERGRRGYIQHPYLYHGHEFGHRTYYYQGRAYDRFYRPYYYRGAYVNVYAPAYYYRPAFYGWAYNPWAAPIAYPWGWTAYPWYGYYGYYFTPYPVYPSASVWLTDYLISTTLAAAYQAQVDAAAAAAAQAASAPPDAAPLSPQVKDLIAAEIQRQIALENAEAQAGAQNAEADPASSGIQRMLTDNVQHIFVAGHDIDVVDASGMECALSDGDALQLSGPPPADATSANLIVLSTKGGKECRRGDNIVVPITDLQEMQNHMRETIDQGMGELQAKQGAGGLPALPPSANGAPVKASFAAAAPPPDPNAGTEIAQETKDADQAETQVLNQAQPPSREQQLAGTTVEPAAKPAPTGPPPTLSPGQTIEEVTAIEGTPKSIVDLGVKKIYVFADGLKVTFKAGKATDIQ